MAIIKRLKRVILDKNYHDIIHTTMDEYRTTMNSKKIAIHTSSNENMLVQSYQDSKVFEVYQSLIQRDYMLYWHHNKESYFIKRENINEIWKRSDLSSIGGLFYTVSKPISARKSEQEPANLIVVFSPTPKGRKLFSSNIADRTFQTYFPNIQKYLPKNTFVLRIMDINLTYGSLYFNTKNYPNMETDVQAIIEIVCKELSVAHDKVVLYGVDSVGLSALYHGIIGNYGSVSTNPYLSLQGMDSEEVSISEFFSNSLEMNLVDNTHISLDNIQVNTDKDKHFVISTVQKADTVQNLDQFGEIHLMKDEYEENEISKNATIEQITFINSYLT